MYLALLACDMYESFVHLYSSKKCSMNRPLAICLEIQEKKVYIHVVQDSSTTSSNVVYFGQYSRETDLEVSISMIKYVLQRK